MSENNRVPVIGIIGYGVVGKALGFGFTPMAKIIHHDPVSSDSLTLPEIVLHSDYIFIAVPTPESATGVTDTTIIESVLDELNGISPLEVVAIKSTVTPDKLKEFKAKYSNLRLVYNPEFLTERTAPFDFINQTRIIIGGDIEDGIELAELYDRRFPHVPQYLTDIIAASMIKYMCNCFFAVKLSYMNEWYEIMKASGTTETWDTIIDMFFSDYRIGNSHMDLPGPDGRMGWGGKCFPKDTAAAVEYAKKIGVRLNTVEAAREVNTRVRGPQKDPDWLE